jgi:predicted enzyme related to lactoylglutathione lyase
MLRSSRTLHFSVTTSDLGRSQAFYSAAFGYEPTLAPVELGDAFARMTGQPSASARLVQLSRSASSETLELIETPDVTHGAVPSCHLAFAVDDLDTALAAARAEGAEILGEVVAFSEGRSAYCREPGGTVFELEELYA